LTQVLDGESKDSGILLYEHMVNLPLPLVPRLHDSLKQDIDWVIENAVRSPCTPTGPRTHG
jgi:hypothetical protein